MFTKASWNTMLDVIGKLSMIDIIGQYILHGCQIDFYA